MHLRYVTFTEAHYQSAVVAVVIKSSDAFVCNIMINIKNKTPD